MSNLIERLRALKKSRSNAPKPPGPDEQAKPAPVPDDSDRGQTLDRLRNLIRQAETRAPAPVKETGEEIPRNGLLTAELLEGPGQNIEDLIPGEYIETPAGRCFRVRTVYPWHHFQGIVPVSSLLDQNTSCLGWMTKDPRLEDLDIRQSLFFDTETTGLEMGAGTYIFLAGFGYFEDRGFVVEQYFMRDFPEEPAVMNQIRELLGRFRFIITFNGKTYDWPLLENRFIVNRLTFPVQNPPHLDLLHIARRLYKTRLPDCRLTSIESEILGFHRMDDLPGALMPQMYYRYLRSRDARFIHKAFAHNSHDIVSLAAMAAEIVKFLNEPSPDARWKGKDMYAMARIHETAGDWEPASKAFREALSLGLDSEFYVDALKRLSLILKRSERWPEAVQIWEVMIRTCGSQDPFAYEELAKYYEHHQKNPREAAKFTRDAISIFSQAWGSAHPVVLALHHRLNRVTGKLGDDDSGIKV